MKAAIASGEIVVVRDGCVREPEERKRIAAQPGTFEIFVTEPRVIGPRRMETGEGA